MAPRGNARLLAPLALVSFAIVFVIVFVSSGDSGGGLPVQTVAPARSAPARTKAPAPITTVPRAATQPVYTVHSGDILSSIAEKTGVSVARIQQLNPDIDPQALVAGQRLKLRP
jgi:LysM repeat protein